MPVISLSFNDMKEMTAAEDDEKRKQEERLARALKRFFSELAAAWAAVYADSGAMIDPMDMGAELSSVLEKSYLATMRLFSGKYMDQLEKQLKVAEESAPDSERAKTLGWWLDIRKRANPIIADAVSFYAVTRAVEQAVQILGTTGDVIARSVAATLARIADEGLTMTNAEIASETRRIIEEYNANRLGTISETEVQNAAQTAKQMEAQTTSDVAASTAAEDDEFETAKKQDIVKTWITMRDKSVRKPHVKAEGQQQQVKDPFIVDDELLMYPGDMSLGASVKNVINCRCNSVIT